MAEIVAMVSQVYTYSHQVVYINYKQLFACQSQLNEVVLKMRERNFSKRWLQQTQHTLPASPTFSLLELSTRLHFPTTWSLFCFLGLWEGQGRTSVSGCAEDGHVLSQLSVTCSALDFLSGGPGSCGTTQDQQFLCLGPSCTPTVPLPSLSHGSSAPAPMLIFPTDKDSNFALASPQPSAKV